MVSPMSEVIRIVLADDHLVVRTGLKLVLEAEEDFEGLAEAADVDRVVRAVLGYKPDVLLLDLNMPGAMSSLDAIPRILESSPAPKIVVLTMQDDPAFARRALADGAKAFVLKEAADVELVAAVRRAQAGGTHLHPSLGARLAAEPSEDSDRLSERERQVLELIALGHTNAEIAEQLFLSVRTVESHRAHIQQKLSLVSRAELVRYALDRGLFQPSGDTP
jgi:two-component system response regulator NreC